MRITIESIVCQICQRPIGDRPADLAPGPHGAVWYVHRDVADCQRALRRRVNRADLTNDLLIVGLLLATAIWVLVGVR